MDHEIPVHIVDNQEYMKVVRSILEEGKEVPLVVTGNSMMPFLIDRRDQVLIKRIERPLKKEILLFFREKTDSILCTEFTLCEKMTELVKTSSILLEMDRKT